MDIQEQPNQTFEPVIIGFTCNWCSYRAADLAGTARTKYPPNVRLIRLMCSGRLDPTFILKAFAEGADAVMVSGCHPGECHYIEQNIKALRRFQLLSRTIQGLGIEPQRLQLVWASAAEGVSSINPAMCQGCGTCVAACPAGAISGSGFSDEQVLAQIEGLLSVGANGAPPMRAAYPDGRHEEIEEAVRA